ncbi:MAG: DUF3857 and transglutaminase domain-containing protein [Zoogloeaceae bacterium]|jgi:hypothetical protein|nr:DUF3857 and transglutaminase domain-containing protein [Zoogloeaceae bacterium]
MALVFLGRAEAVLPETGTRLLKTEKDYVFAPDGSYTLTVSGGLRVLDAAALARINPWRLAWLRGVQELEALEVWTQKANGARIAVAPERIHMADAQRTVDFPDLAVGDALMWQYRLQQAPVGAVVLEERLSPFAAMEEWNVSVRVPEALAVKTASFRMALEPPETRRGVTTYRWRYHNPAPRSPEAERDAGVWYVRDTPSLFLSGFSDYGALAHDYETRAWRKLEVTEDLRALAGEIAGEETSRREAARLFYEWVRLNMAPAGECPWAGALLPPEDPGAALNARKGGCRARAAVLQALLATREIESVPVLLAEDYDLPRKTPVFQRFSEVLLYLPEWALHLSLSAPDLPFGYLPDAWIGRPVVRAAMSEPEILQNPEQPPTEQRVDTELTLNAKGEAEGRVRLLLKGVHAARARAFLQGMTPEAQTRFIRDMLVRASNGYASAEGLTLEVEAGDAAPETRLSSQYEFAVRFTQADFFPVQQGLWQPTALVTVVTGFAQLAEQDLRRERQRDQPCVGGRLRETYAITLNGVRFTRVPEAMTRHTEYLDYESRVEQTDLGIWLDRSLTDKTPTGLCNAEFFNAWLRDLAPVVDNLQQPFAYEREEVPVPDEEEAMPE